MMRWGAMSFFAWILSKAGAERVSGSAAMWTAIVVSSLLFGAGHLPAVGMLTPLTGLLVFRTVFLNAIGGVCFGYLFWRRNLETAMVAHGAVHIAFTLLALI